MIRIASQPEEKRFKSLAWKKPKHHHLQTANVSHERRARTQSMSLKSWLIILWWYEMHHIQKKTSLFVIRAKNLESYIPKSN